MLNRKSQRGLGYKVDLVTQITPVPRRGLATLLGLDPSDHQARGAQRVQPTLQIRAGKATTRGLMQDHIVRTNIQEIHQAIVRTGAPTRVRVLMQEKNDRLSSFTIG